MKNYLFKKKLTLFITGILYLFLTGICFGALVVPTDIQLPGTQPREVSKLESPDKCDNCHGGYDEAVEPAFNWRGSMMANAGRDPLFWATVAIAEQDFDGSGDLCIRCHSTAGWLGGRSTPTDGSGLLAGDSDGVECDYCHKLTDPDNSEFIGVQNDPFLAYKDYGADPAIAYYGSGMSSIWAGSEKLGPYRDAEARHQAAEAQFQRSENFCGTCHDVSNSAVGDLAHNNGAQPTADPVISSGIPGAPVNGKAAFNNFPYQYGIVERTFSEYKSSILSTFEVSDYLTLPADLQGGALQTAYERAIVAGKGGRYEDGQTRFFTCQTCHMPPVTGAGCNKKGVPIRKDLPQHDLTGGNYWIMDAIQYLDLQGKLRLGGDLTAVQIAAMNDAKTRAMAQLSDAGALEVNGNTLKVINQTGHKLISGYPEGRRMWLNIKWYDDNATLIDEEGAYGPLTVTIDNETTQVDTILDLHNTQIYEAHYGMTQEWAAQLLALAYPADMPLSFDRLTGETDYTLGELGGTAPGHEYETFHFVLNNTVIKDNRIPPYRMSYDEGRKRNILPVPADTYGNPGPGGEYNYWDEVTLNPPPGAASATIDLLYQPTSWEYIQFLYEANTGEIAFLANEGEYMLEAWQNTGMAAPYTITTVNWYNPDTDADGVPNDVDNCPDTCNSQQLDADGDGIGDVCDSTPGCGGCGASCEIEC